MSTSFLNKRRQSANKSSHCSGNRIVSGIKADANGQNASAKSIVETQAKLCSLAVEVSLHFWEIRTYLDTYLSFKMICCAVLPLMALRGSSRRSSRNRELLPSCNLTEFQKVEL